MDDVDLYGLNIPVEVFYAGITVRGIIIYADSAEIIVLLKNAGIRKYSGEIFLCAIFIMAHPDHPFVHDETLTQGAYVAAQEGLVAMYEKAADTCAIMPAFHMRVQHPSY